MVTYFLAAGISYFGDIIIMLICIWAIMSLFTASFPRTLMKVYDFLGMIVEPFIRPFRGLMARFGSGMGLDFSPLIAILAIRVVCRIIASILLLI